MRRPPALHIPFKMSCFLASYSFSVINPCLYMLFKAVSFWTLDEVVTVACEDGQAATHSLCVFASFVPNGGGSTATSYERLDLICAVLVSRRAANAFQR